MEIIKKAYILNDIDLHLLENHSLDKVYRLRGIKYKKVTRLILISFLHKYPKILLNNIQKKYQMK